jgi:hypothetical protein
MNDPEMVKGNRLFLILRLRFLKIFKSFIHVPHPVIDLSQVIKDYCVSIIIVQSIQIKLQSSFIISGFYQQIAKCSVGFGIF